MPFLHVLICVTTPNLFLFIMHKRPEITESNKILMKFQQHLFQRQPVVCVLCAFLTQTFIISDNFSSFHLFYARAKVNVLSFVGVLKTSLPRTSLLTCVFVYPLFAIVLSFRLPFSASHTHTNTFTLQQVSACRQAATTDVRRRNRFHCLTPPIACSVDFIISTCRLTLTTRRFVSHTSLRRFLHALFLLKIYVRLRFTACQ